MTNRPLTYTESIQAIEQILERFRTEQMDVDQLAAEVKRATELITACRECLTKVEEEVQKILDE